MKNLYRNTIGGIYNDGKQSNNWQKLIEIGKTFKSDKLGWGAGPGGEKEWNSHS